MNYRRQNSTLSTLCAIQTGYTARSRLEPAATHGVPAIQLRDLRGEEAFTLGSAGRYALEGALDRYRVQPGDVLFRSRGEQNTAIVVGGTDADEPAVALLPLMILRPKAGVISSEYLAWFINLPDSQRYFDGCARGTNMRMIPRPCLEKLPVAVPDLKTQQLIAEVAALARRERALTEALAEKRQAFANLALLDQVQKARPGDEQAGPSPGGKARKPNAGKKQRSATASPVD